jgi:hypothetical protein
MMSFQSCEKFAHSHPFFPQIILCVLLKFGHENCIEVDGLGYYFHNG